MIDIRRRRLSTALATAPLAAMGFPGLVRAQGKPITVILTVPPGSLDTLARAVGEKLRAKLNRNVVVESKAGGGGAVAVQYIKQGPTDGSMFLLTPTSMISMHALFASSPSFDHEKDLVPVSEVAASPHTITVSRALGVDTFAGYVEAVRKDPKLGSIGTPSLAGLATLMIYQMRKTLKLDLQYVPYKGGQPLLTDLLGNHITAGASVMADYLPEHRNGRIRILAHASNVSSPLAPDIPTFKELGYPFYEARTTFGYYAKKGTSDAVVAEFARHLNEAIVLPDVVKQLQNIGLSPIVGSPEAYARVLQNDARQWGPLIIESGLKIN